MDTLEDEVAEVKNRSFQTMFLCEDLAKNQVHFSRTMVAIALGQVLCAVTILVHILTS